MTPKWSLVGQPSQNGKVPDQREGLSQGSKENNNWCLALTFYFIILSQCLSLRPDLDLLLKSPGDSSILPAFLRSWFIGTKAAMAHSPMG